jgi:hypothetical protein
MPDMLSPEDLGQSAPSTDAAQPQQQAAPPSPQSQPSQPAPQSLDDTRAILSGQPGSNVANGANDGAQGNMAPMRTGMFGRILKGALMGLAEGGIPGAVEGAISPKTAQTTWTNRQQMAQSKVDFFKAHAAIETTNALQANNVMERQDAEWKQNQSDRAVNKMMELQNLGLSPSEFPNDDAANAVRIANDFVGQGKIPYVLHAPSEDGVHGQLIVYDLSPVLKSQAMPAAVKQGLTLVNDPTTDAENMKMNPTQRLAVVQKGLTGVDFTPGGTPSEILGQINQLTSLKRVYATAHTNDPDLNSTMSKYDASISSLQQKPARISDEGKIKAQNAGDIAEAAKAMRWQGLPAGPAAQAVCRPELQASAHTKTAEGWHWSRRRARRQRWMPAMGLYAALCYAGCLLCTARRGKLRLLRPDLAAHPAAGEIIDASSKGSTHNLFVRSAKRRVPKCYPEHTGLADANRTTSQSVPVMPNGRALLTATVQSEGQAPYFEGGSMNALTATLFGCSPAGIMVSKPYSPGSSFRGLRF